MRPSAIVPIILALGTLVLSFICLFAGSKTSFLPNYAIMTLNTSQIGHGFLDTDVVKNHPDLQALLQGDTQDTKDEVEKAINALAKEMGIHDFYNVHVLSYCEGNYTPTAIPNVTYRLSDIKKVFTKCSTQQVFYQFDPTEILQQELDSEGGAKLTVADLHWPSDVSTSLQTFHVAQKATFILYVIAMSTGAASAFFGAIGFCTSGRFAACVNVMIAIVGFLASGLASAIITVASLRGSAEVNKYVESIGVLATPGYKILGLSWGATGAMLVTIIWWSAECSVARKRARGSSSGQ